jgi:hypothetical protein
MTPMAKAGAMKKEVMSIVMADDSARAVGLPVIVGRELGILENSGLTD